MQIFQKRLLFIVLLVLMLLPFIQSKIEYFAFKPMDGSFELADKPDLKWFTWKSWFNEKFQTDINKSIDDNIGFRNLLLRLNNQIDYSFFHLSSTYKAIIGRSDCLYEEGYILDYTGQNFVGKDSINKILYRTKWVQDYLKKEKNIELILVLEPGKASFHPEFIPSRYHVENKTISNYLYYAQECKALNINFLDLNTWFMSMKKTSKYPLYPKYGVHWSTYGMCLAADTLVKYIEKIKGIDMPDLYWDNIRVTDKLKDVDFDLEITLNLLFPLPHETMAYPIIAFEKNAEKIKPNVLTIADSYYWSIFNSKLPENLFAKHEFWYYNTTIYPHMWGEDAIYVDHTKDKENIEKQDVILLMITELNMNKAFFGFIDNAYKIYHP